MLEMGFSGAGKFADQNEKENEETGQQFYGLANEYLLASLVD